MQTPERTGIKKNISDSNNNSNHNDGADDSSSIPHVLAAPGVECLRHGGVKVKLHGQDGRQAMVVCSGDILCMRSEYFHEVLHEWDGEQPIDEVLDCELDEGISLLQYLHRSARAKLVWNRCWAALSVKWVIPDLQDAYREAIQQALRATAPLEQGDRVQVDEHIVKAEFGRAISGTLLRNCSYMGYIVGWEQIGDQRYAVVQLDGTWQVACTALKVAGVCCMPGTNLTYSLHRQPRCQQPIVDLGSFPTFCVHQKYLTRVVSTPMQSFPEHWWEMAQAAIRFSHFRSSEQSAHDVVMLMLGVLATFRRQVWDKAKAKAMDPEVLVEMLDRVL